MVVNCFRKLQSNIEKGCDFHTHINIFTSWKDVETWEKEETDITSGVIVLGIVKKKKKRFSEIRSVCVEEKRIAPILFHLHHLRIMNSFLPLFDAFCFRWVGRF